MAKKQLTELQNAWLTSLIDLLLLISCFFIMVYSVLSNGEQGQTRLVKSLKAKFQHDNTFHYSVQTKNLSLIYHILTQAIQANNLQHAAMIVKNKEYIQLNIDSHYIIAMGELRYNEFVKFLNTILFNLANVRIEYQILMKEISTTLIDNQSIDQSVGELKSYKQIELFWRKAITIYQYIKQNSVNNIILVINPNIVPVNIMRANSNMIAAIEVRIYAKSH